LRRIERSASAREEPNAKGRSARGSNLHTWLSAFVGPVVVAVFGAMAFYFWKPIFGHELSKDDTAIVGSIAALGVVLFIVGFLIWSPSRFWGWVHVTRAASGEKLAIFVAWLDGDNARGRYRASVMSSIRDAIGVDTVEVRYSDIRVKYKSEEDFNKITENGKNQD
jgi:hypothetical protein